MLKIAPLFAALLFVLTPVDSIAAGAVITTRVGNAFGDANVDALPGEKYFGLGQGEDPADLEYGEFLLFVVISGGVDLFGLTRYRTTGDFDPYNAFSIQLTNLAPSPQQVEIQVSSDIFSTASPNNIEIYLDAAVEDTDSSGDAQFSGGSTFSGAIDLGTFALVPLAQNNAFSLTPGAATTVLDAIGPGANFGDFGVATVEQLFMGTIGTLSPGDSIVLNGFMCIYESGGSCPERPDLSFTVVPLPAGIWFVASALCAFFRMNGRSGGYRGKT